MKQKKTREGKVVLCGGTFDLVHPGHIYFLEQARRLGDTLIVVISTKKRGSSRKTINSAEKRAMVVSALKPVDFAIIGGKGNILDIVAEIGPDVIALGPNQKYNEKEMKQELKDMGLKIKVKRVKDKIRGSSTTSLIKRVKALKDI